MMTTAHSKNLFKIFRVGRFYCGSKIAVCRRFFAAMSLPFDARICFTLFSTEQRSLPKAGECFALHPKHPVSAMIVIGTSCKAAGQQQWTDSALQRLRYRSLDGY